MFEILIVTHGTLGKALVESAELIAGQQSGIKTIGLKLGEDLDAFKKEVEDSIQDSLSRGELLVLTDLMFGTPFNCVSSLAGSYNFHHFTGVNLPIYLEVITSRKFVRVDDICMVLKEVGRSSFACINDLLEKEVEE